MIKALSFGLIAIAAAGMFTIDETQGQAVSSPDQFAIVMEYQGEAFAIDHGMSIGDCFAALPRNDVAKGVFFACERGEG